MKSLNKIAVIADLLTAEPALSRAVALAKACKAELVLYAFVHDSLGDDDALLSDKERHAYREKLIDARHQALAVELKSVAPKFRPNIEVIWHKRYHEWLCDNVKKRGIDLVIKHGRPSKKAFYMPSDWHLMRRLPVPLWLVDDRSPAEGAVVAAIDAGDKRSSQKKLDQQVLQTGALLAPLMKAKLKSVFVRALPQLLFDLDLVDHRSYKNKAEEQAKAASAKRCKEAGVDDQVSNNLVGFGHPEDMLPRLLRKEKAALLVMGTVGRKGVEEWLVGNTSERVIADVRCDVLIIKG